MAKRALLLDKTMMSAPPVPVATPAVSAPTQRAVKDYGEALNFRVPPEFGQQFRMVALRRRMKLNQLLQRCFEVYLREEGGAERP